ncbi:MAG: hypothetical protein ACK5XX_06830 [Holosporales bacterium]
MKHLSAFEKISFGSGTGQKARYSYESGAPDPKVEQGVWRWLADDILKTTQKRDVTPYSSAALEAQLKAYNAQSLSTDKPLISRKEVPGQAGFFTVERLNLNGQYESVKDTGGNSIVCDKEGRLIQQDGAGQYFVRDAESGGYIAPNDDTATPLTLRGTSRPILLSSSNKIFAKQSKGWFDEHGDSIKIDSFQFLSGAQIINAIGDGVKEQRARNKANENTIDEVRNGAFLKTAGTAVASFAVSALVVGSGGIVIAAAVAAGCAALAYFQGRGDRIAKIDAAAGQIETIDGNYLRNKEMGIAKNITGAQFNAANLTAANVPVDMAKELKERFDHTLATGATSPFADETEFKNVIAARAAQIHGSTAANSDNDNTEKSGNSALMNYVAMEIKSAIEWNAALLSLGTGGTPINNETDLNTMLNKYNDRNKLVSGNTTPEPFGRDGYNDFIAATLGQFGRTR